MEPDAAGRRGADARRRRRSSIARSSGPTCKPWEARARRGPRRGAARSSSSTARSSRTCAPEGQPFDLWRVWGHGGKTNVWGRVSLRYSRPGFRGPGAATAGRFRGRSATADIAPYYDKVDQLIGVCGGDDDSESLPGSKYHLPPPAPRCGERLLQKARRLARHPHRRRPPRQHDAIGARLPALPLLRRLRPRLRHRVVLLLGRSPAAVRAGDGEARDSIERRRGARAGRRRRARRAACSTSTARPAREQQVLRQGRGRRPPAASTRRASCSTRRSSAIRTASATAPTSSAAICASRSASTSRGFLPDARTASRGNDRGIRRAHLPAALQPSARAQARLSARLRHAVLEHRLQLAGRRPLRANDLDGFGAGLKSEIKRRYPAWFEMHPYGEVLPYAHNRITVDAHATDRYGVPLSKIDYQIGDNERKMPEHMYDAVEEICHAAKAELVELQARRARRQRVGDPRARHLPHGRAIRSGRRSTGSTRCTK